MKISLAKSAGFCFGVKRALDIAFKVAGDQRSVQMLGDIVHNEDVVREIQKAGIKKVSGLRRQEKDTILLIRAHGSAVSTSNKARNFGYTIVDATCPMVKEIHRIAKDMESKGYRIIVIGDKNHDEVMGIIGQLKGRAVILDTTGHIPLDRVKKIHKACVVAQSTQNMDKVLEIVKSLKRYIKKLEFFNTICMPTRIKQEEIKRMPLENDVMIIIGSKDSANTKRLYEISKSLNKHSYRINSKEDIKPQWFKGVKNVGVTAGASTPESRIQEIVGFISCLSSPSP